MPNRFRIILALVALICLSSLTQAQPTVTRVERTDQGFALLREGKPYIVKGAGGHQYLDQLAAAGGNTIRTWGVGAETKQLLDEAHRHGIAVVVGIWLEHERHGYDYGDLDFVAKQFEKVRAAVEQYKDHPAVLAWAIGNEMEGFGEGDNPAIWSHVEACAALVKRLDPNHPTMTVIAEIGGRKVEAVHALCPSIDILGINSYGGVQSLPQRYAAAGGTKPYLVTEFGPAGTWEVGRNSFNAVEELTSTQKAGIYRDAYAKLAADTGKCLGSFAFLWGNKVEATTTWFGMFLDDGSKLAAVDAMHQAWSGTAPDNRCPVIEPLKIEGTYEKKPGAEVTVKFSATDPEGEPLKVVWTLLADASQYETGGDLIDAPPTYEGQIVSSDAEHCTLTLPSAGGIYRLYAVVKDPAGNAAVANVPLYAGGSTQRVDGPAPGATSSITPGKPLDLPAVVYNEADGPSPWIASGYMGNAGQIAMDPNYTIQPHAGKTCLRVEYRAADQWGGVVWQDPANDWGDAAGGYNLTGATALEFYARGAAGGEVVNFGFGVLGIDAKHPDSGSGKLNELRLTGEWRKYRIELGSDVDLRRIKTGFFWSLGGQGQPVTFYLDDIRFVGQEAE